MSALVSEPMVAPPQEGAHPAPTVPSRPVVVRRNALVALTLGAASSAIGTAYLYRAVSSGALLDWVLCAVMGLLGATFLAGLLDARTPLLVADDLGVRIRLGRQWRALPWEGVDHLLVRPRRGISDGRLTVSLDHVQRAVEGLDPRARRAAALNRRLYGGLLTVPLGLTTRWGSSVPALADRLELLAAGRTRVMRTAPGEPAPTPAPAPAVEPPTGRPGSRDSLEPDVVPAPMGLAPVRGARRLVAARIAGPRPVVAPVLGSAAPVTEPLEVAALPEAEELRRADTPFPEPGPLRRRRVRRVEAPVIEDFATEPAYDPVIGPELASARTRVGLSVDELAERTRIRPHVIESIEVDDFGPCGGDFYARGHIRTLARALGKDSGPMLATFERRYAGVPPSARRVFEAELATGLTGGARRGAGGPSWGLLVTVVLALALIWSIVRLVAVPDPERLTAPPALNGSGGVTSWRTPGAQPARPVAQPVPATVSAVNGDTVVVVAGRDGRVVFEGEMVMGESRSFRVVPPVRVRADQGGVLNVWVAGRDRGLLGEEGMPATQSYRGAAR